MLEKQVRRMLADPHASALTTNFAGQWLHLQNLKGVSPDLFEYPDFDRTLADSMRRETELLFDSIVREDRNVTDLLTANYTFVNERLAKHYGIPNILGSRFRRVTLDRSESLWAAGTCQHPDADIDGHSNFAGAARKVRDGSVARYAASSGSA